MLILKHLDWFFYVKNCEKDILIVLVSLCQKRFKSLSLIQVLQAFESIMCGYSWMALLILCKIIKTWQTLRLYFCQMTLMKIIRNTWRFSICMILYKSRKLYKSYNFYPNILFSTIYNWTWYWSRHDYFIGEIPE